MRKADVRHYRDIRLGDARELGDLARNTHARLEDDEAVHGVDAERGRGEADSIVEIPRRGE